MNVWKDSSELNSAEITDSSLDLIALQPLHQKLNHGKNYVIGD